MSRSTYVPLSGGIDLVTPPRHVAPGKALYAVNYECPVTGGYRRIDGYTQLGPEVPGEGPLLGVKLFFDEVYVIRKDTGKDSATLHVYNDSSDAWDVVGTGEELHNGRHEFVEGNFLATSSGRALYMVGGGKPFELKGGTLKELSGAQDGATFIAVHRNHLFIGLDVGSVQHSSLGDPDDWNTSTGTAGEIGMSQQLTGILPGRGGVLHMLCRDSIKTLYGASIEDWELKTTIPNSGAKRHTAQSWLDTYYVSERGITGLHSSDQFGDFQPMQPGAAIEPIFTQQGYASRAVCSQVSKRLAQYRVFFDDGMGVYMSPSGMTLVNFPDKLSCADAGEMDSGLEVLLYGTDDGRVLRQEDESETFCGEPITAFLTLAYNDLDSPSMRKRYRRVFWDIRSGASATVRITPDLDFGNIAAARHITEYIEFLQGGGMWNVDRWGEFAWSAPVQAQEPVDIAATGNSINFSVYSSAGQPHEILGYDLIFTPRRVSRG